MSSYSYQTKLSQAVHGLYGLLLLGVCASNTSLAVTPLDTECSRLQEIGFQVMPYSVIDPVLSHSVTKMPGVEMGPQDKAPCQIAALPPGVKIESDVPYGEHPAQRMDIYLPPTADLAPIIFMVHGGGWRSGDKAAAPFVENKIARWVPQGFVVISVNYRLLPEAHPLEQVKDIANAFAFAQRHAKRWGADPSRILLLGHSAGAHLVALFSSDAAMATSADLPPALGSVVLDSAALDVPRIMRAPHFNLYDQAFGSSPLYWRAASPAHRINGMPAPMLIVCSTFRDISCEQGQSFSALIGAQGSRAELAPLEFTHQEINVLLGLDEAYTQRVEAFMRSLGL